MLIFDATRVMKLRGVERKYKYLIDNGFSHTTAANLANGQVAAVKIRHIGDLCQLLNCTPNDLYKWQPDAKNPLPETHALNALVREEIPLNFKKLLKDIPIEKLGEAENLLKSLKDG